MGQSANRPLPEHLTLLEAYVDYLECERRLSVHTLRAYTKDIEELLVYLSENKLGLFSMTPKELRAYFSKRIGSSLPMSMECNKSKRNLSKRSQARKLASIRDFFRFLERRKGMKSNPAMQLHSPRFQKPLPTVLGPGEIEDVFDRISSEESRLSQEGKIPEALKARNLAICEMLYSSGMRISELLNLRLADVQQLPDEVKIVGKGEKQRFVFFGLPSRRVLNDYLQKRACLCSLRSSDRLFLKDDVHILNNPRMLQEGLNALEEVDWLMSHSIGGILPLLEGKHIRFSAFCLFLLVFLVHRCRFFI